jgi:glutaredoxin
MTATKKRKVEVFTAGCPVCDDAVKLVKSLACDSCEVEVLDMKQADVASRAKGYGVRSVPAVVIDGKLADCCSGRGPDADTLRAAGLGQPV